MRVAAPWTASVPSPRLERPVVAVSVTPPSPATALAHLGRSVRRAWAIVLPALRTGGRVNDAALAERRALAMRWLAGQDLLV